MKQIVSAYSFDKTAKTVTFTDFSSISLNRLLLITNVTANTVIYQFNNPSLGGTASGNVLTLACNTSGMANSDKLQIIYDTASGDPVYDAPSVFAQGLVASGAVDTGNPVKVGGRYNATPPSLADGQRGDLQLDNAARPVVTMGTLLAGEDLANDVLKTEQRFQTSGALTTDTQVKSSAGFVHTITVVQTDAAPTAGIIDVYDSTSASGTKIFSWALTVNVFAPFTAILDVRCANGIYVDFTTTNDVAVFISYR